MHCICKYFFNCSSHAYILKHGIGSTTPARSPLKGIEGVSYWQSRKIYNIETQEKIKYLQPVFRRGLLIIGFGRIFLYHQSLIRLRLLTVFRISYEKNI